MMDHALNITSDEKVAPVFYNYREKSEHENAGKPYYAEGEQPGYSVFLRDGDKVFRTYSTFARGVELLVSSIQFLDLTGLGRQEG